MGTRHLIIAITDGETKLRQYGQWDGYPYSEGLNVLQFLRSHDLDKLKSMIGKHYPLDKDTIKEIESNCTGKNLYIQYPEYSRDTSSGILDLIYQDKANGQR